ncbi:MAG: NAD(P)-binding domain-containing protein [Microthrixaceae bacterium]|nr:NAD(P)-binding domain-containing protein [Microthrixaceae bacterium]
MIGLGRMGANLVRRLMREGHRCVVHDVDAEAVEALVAEGATGAHSIEELVAAPRGSPRRVDHGPRRLRGGVVEELAVLLEPGDVIVDGGNSYYRDDLDRAQRLRPSGIHYLDCGTSGGVWGLERGYCLMIGGDSDAVRRLEPIFATIAPGEGVPTRHRDAAPAGPPRTATCTAAPAVRATS